MTSALRCLWVPKADDLGDGPQRPLSWRTVSFKERFPPSRQRARPWHWDVCPLRGKFRSPPTSVKTPKGENVFRRINSGSISTASKFWNKNVCRTHGYLEVPILVRKFQWASGLLCFPQMSLPGLGRAGERASTWTSGKMGTEFGHVFQKLKCLFVCTQ